MLRKKTPAGIKSAMKLKTILYYPFLEMHVISLYSKYRNFKDITMAFRLNLSSKL